MGALKPTDQKRIGATKSVEQNYMADNIPVETSVSVEHLPAPSLQRGLRILETIANSKNGMTLSQISLRFGFCKSTTFRLLRTLREMGYVHCFEEERRYFVTDKLLTLGKEASVKLSLRSGATPHLRTLRKTSNLTVLLAAVEGCQVVVVEQFEAPSSHISSWVGKRLPLHSTSIGKVALAFMPDEEIDLALKTFGMQRFNVNTIVSSERLKRHLNTVRNQGFAFENEESELEVRSVAAPIFSHLGKVVAAIALAGTPRQITLENLANLGEIVKGTADTLKIGFSTREICPNSPHS